MKRKLIECFVLMTLFFTFNACEDEVDISEAIIGTWSVTNMTCIGTANLDADIITFTSDYKVSIKHYEDESGYGVIQYDDTYFGSWRVEDDRVWLTMGPGVWAVPNNLVIKDIQKNQITFSPWGEKGKTATMERYVETASNSIYGYWELTKCTGTFTDKNGNVTDVRDGSFSFRYLYFSKEDLQSYKGYNGLIVGAGTQLINYEFDGSKIVIYKINKGSFLDGDFVLENLSENHAILHFGGYDSPNEFLDVKMYLTRVPTFKNQ